MFRQVINNVLTMYFNDMNIETDLNIALILDTDYSHIVFDANGTSTLSFNNKSIEINKYFEQTSLTTQIDKQIIAAVSNNTNEEVSTTTNTPVTVSNDITVEPRSGTATDFGPHITSATVSKLHNGQWVESTEFEDGDQVKVHISYNLPADTVTGENDSICYQLPDGVKPMKKETGAVYASNGKAVGTYIIDKIGRAHV